MKLIYTTDSPGVLHKGASEVPTLGLSFDGISQKIMDCKTLSDFSFLV
jgi:hypothetical protein